MSDIHDALIAAAESAIVALAEAWVDFVSPTAPQTPLGRLPRWWGMGLESVIRFDISETSCSIKYTWSWPTARAEKDLSFIRKEAAPHAAGVIVKACGCHPSRVERFVLTAERHVAWLRKARAGRERAAREIIKQQTRALESLKARNVIDQL